MSIRRTLTALVLCAAIASTSVAAPPPDKGGGKGGGNDGGGEDPPAEPFVPAIAYFEESPKGKDLKLSNRAGDQACVVLQSGSGTPKLRGFVYHAASKMLAYSKGDTGIYLATWANDPCFISEEGAPIRSGVGREFMDFSPDGRLLAWTEDDKSYTGFGSSHFIFIYDVVDHKLTQLDLEQWGDSRPDWGVVDEWSAGSVHFSPDFATSNEIIFSGAPLSGSQGAYKSLFKYNLNELAKPVKLFDGADVRFDAFVTVTNPGSGGSHKVAFGDTNSGEVLQVRLSDKEIVRFKGSEPAYGCDNSELIHQFSAKGNKTGAYITAADGSSSQQWSGSGPRFFDWFCP